MFNIHLDNFFLIEFILRFIFPATEIPTLYYNSNLKMNTYKPKQEGQFTIGPFARFKSQWEINNWGFRGIEKILDSNPSHHKIVVIGDSFVDALQVNEENDLHQLFKKNIHNSNVYPLGISGMPISGYLEVRRAIKDILQPDLIIYLIVDNDFSESLFGNHMVSFSDKSRLNLMYGVETGENKEVKLTEFLHVHLNATG